MNFSQNSADQARLTTHLHRCDDSFVPRLSDRINIKDYANKLFNYAERYEAWENQELIGLVAAYCNDREDRTAFITNVSVAPEWRGQGIATQLLGNCINYLRLNRFKSAELEVGKHNRLAFEMYRKLGFKTMQKQRTPLSIALILPLDALCK